MMRRYDPGMPTTGPPPLPLLASAPLRRIVTAADWVESLGGVPLDRIRFDPWPGTATERDLLALAEGNGPLCELIHGTLVEKTAGLPEAVAASNLGGQLGHYVKSNALGVVSGPDSTLRMRSTDHIRLPDVCYFAKDRLPGGVLPREAVPTLAPDLAVEVLSAANTRREMAQKLAEYFGSGTRLVWFVDPPTRTVAVYHGPGEPTRVLGDADALDGEDVVPGFTMAVADLFLNLPDAPSETDRESPDERG